MPLVGEDQTQTGRHRVSVGEAAGILGTTAEGVRGRIKRGTLQSVKEGRKVYVLLSADQMAAERQPAIDQTTDQAQPDALLEALGEMRAQVRFLREQLQAEWRANEENRRLLAAALERIPAIEAPAEPGESPETATEQPGRVGAQTPLSEAPQSTWESLGEEPEGTDTRSSGEEAQEGAERRSLWRRLFGG
jgi:hypothetical protein